MSTKSPKHVVIIAGEASGDHYGAELAKQLMQRHPDIVIAGIGGQNMQANGVTLLQDLAQYGVVGFTEVVKLWRVIKSAFRIIKAYLTEQKPDLLVLIDYPGFNLRMAKFAKKLGIKVLYYISPQIWAYKAGRIKTIRNNVDHMAVILPFEQLIYQQANVPVSFVGHPLCQSVKPTMSEQQARQFFHCQPDSTVIGLLPGSRLDEIHRLLPTMLDAAEQIAAKHDCEFILPIANTIDPLLIESLVAKRNIVLHLATQHRFDAMNICHSVIATSGTVTLESALLHKPMVICYKTSRISYWIGRCLIRIQHIGLPNILANDLVVPELIQDQVTADNIFRIMDDYLQHDTLYQSTREKLITVADSLAQQNAQVELINLVDQLL